MARFDEAVASLEPAAELYGESGDVEARGRIMAQIGGAHAGRGTGAAGVALLNAELDAARGISPQGMARLYLSLANLYTTEAQFDAALTACERAEALARVADDQGTLIRALSRRGTVLCDQAGQVESGLAGRGGGSRLA